MKRSANNPTRVEYIEAVLEYEIWRAEEKKKSGRPITIDEFISFLKDLHKTFLEPNFADDRGPEKGSPRQTSQNRLFRLFRKKYPNSKDFDLYIEWCDSQKPPIPENHRYVSQDSFRDRLKREKKNGV